MKAPLFILLSVALAFLSGAPSPPEAENQSKVDKLLAQLPGTSELEISEPYEEPEEPASETIEAVLQTELPESCQLWNLADIDNDGRKEMVFIDGRKILWAEIGEDGELEMKTLKSRLADGSLVDFEIPSHLRALGISGQFHLNRGFTYDLDGVELACFDDEVENVVAFYEIRDGIVSPKPACAEIQLFLPFEWVEDEIGYFELQFSEERPRITPLYIGENSNGEIECAYEIDPWGPYTSPTLYMASASKFRIEKNTGPTLHFNTLLGNIDPNTEYSSKAPENWIALE